jgi:hypothetical protein
VAELIAARLLLFGGRGVTGAVDSSTVAYQYLGRLADQSGPVRYYRGCVCEELPLGEYARRSLGGVAGVLTGNQLVRM